MEHISYIDVCLLVLVVLLGAKSIYQGFVRSFGSLVGLLLGIFLAARLNLQAGEIFGAYVYNFSPQINKILAFVIVLSVVWLLAIFVSEIITRRLHNTIIERLDKSLGLIFGFCKSFVFVAIIAFGVAQISFLEGFAQKMEKESFVYPIMKSFAITIMNLEVVNETTRSLGDITKQTESGIETANTLQNGLQKGQEILGNIQSLKPKE
ncbi:CvpA family protein [uncultured Helicobacter sp.]|uniref:CvpA family protein n=1 Tax=uncultured Helicobacter sp. TaxID=175537 RepID=UPI00374F6E19